MLFLQKCFIHQASSLPPSKILFVLTWNFSKGSKDGIFNEITVWVTHTLFCNVLTMCACLLTKFQHVLTICVCLHTKFQHASTTGSTQNLVHIHWYPIIIKEYTTISENWDVVNVLSHVKSTQHENKAQFLFLFRQKHPKKIEKKIKKN